MTHALAQPEDKTKFKLLFANVTPADILLKDEFDELKAKHGDRFDVTYIIDKAEKGWNGRHCSVFFLRT